MKLNPLALQQALLGALLGFAFVLPTRATPLRPWRDYHTIMWIGESASRKPEKLPLFFQRLREMGINTGMVYGGADPEPLVQNQFQYYVENVINRGLCLKFSSQVTDWDKFITTWSAQGRPESALVRDYCLDDPKWLAWARGEMQSVTRLNRSHRPLAYNIRDELSTTFSANPLDYDFNPVALEQFREWLKRQYPDLAALNSEWQTKFSSWEQVRPFTTDQIKNRMASGEPLPPGKPDWQALEHLKFQPEIAASQPTRWNFSPWADFRTYMDVSLARSLDLLRGAAHEEDPATPVGIEGTQMPDAFGGYDLWRLSQALDWVEPYDVGSAHEIFSSFMPGKPLLTTVFEKETNPARRRLWHLLLEGDRGCIVWWSEDCLDFNNPEYPLTAKARALAPELRELTSPLAQRVLRAQPEHDPVFSHYSQPSIQADWLLESTVDGPTWVRRFSSFEASHNRQLKIRDGWVKLFQDLGYSPVFISSDQLAHGLLTSGPYQDAALVLPNSWALSDEEVKQIRAFVNPERAQRGTRALVWDGTPGVFDEHARLRGAAPLPFAFTNSSSTCCVALNDAEPPRAHAADLAAYPRQRLGSSNGVGIANWISDQLKSWAPEISVPAEARVRIHRFRVSGARLVAFERNIDYQMSEDLKQAGGNESLEHPITLDARLGKAAYIYDLRTERYLGFADHIRFTLDPWQPSLFALSQKKSAVPSLVKQLLPN